MARFLPITISLFVISYSLFVSSSFAQEITPSVTSVSQINPQASAWEDFLKNLVPAQFKKIPDSLTDVNRANLPPDVGNALKPANSAVSAQAADKTAANKETVGNAAGQYVVASGVHTPPQVAEASTDIFSNLFNAIKNFFASLFDRGETQAKNYAGTVAPPVVVGQNFAQGIENITGIAATSDTNVLGAQTGGAAMEKSLPFVQCSELPPDLCPK